MPCVEGKCGWSHQQDEDWRGWGTQVELAAAATYFKVPLFGCTPHPQTQQYYWLCFNPLQGKFQYPDIGNGDEALKPISLSHIELCNTSAVHYDCVLRADNMFPTECPKLMGTCEDINLTITWSLKYVCMSHLMPWIHRWLHLWFYVQSYVLSHPAMY